MAMAQNAAVRPPAPSWGTSGDPKTDLADGAPKADRLQPYREIATLVIAIAILILAAWTLVRTYNSAASSSVEVFGRQKDITLYALSLLATAMGYYFGRAPAELRASHAEAAAITNQKSLSETQNRLANATTESLETRLETERIKADVRRTLSPLVATAERPGLLGIEGSAKHPEVATLQANIQQLLDRLG
jgi:hypothetical protein